MQRQGSVRGVTAQSKVAQAWKGDDRWSLWAGLAFLPRWALSVVLFWASLGRALGEMLWSAVLSSYIVRDYLRAHVIAAWDRKAVAVARREEYALRGQALAANPFLLGNFAPVAAETAIRDLEPRGLIPIALNGVYVRNGPNPRPENCPRDPRTRAFRNHVWLDGDAMVHCVVTNNGRLAYASHWVVSGLQQHREERAAEAKQQQESAVAAAGKAEPVRSEPVPPSVFLTLSDLVSSPLDPAIVVPVREGAAPFIRPPQPAAAASAAAAAKPPSSLPPAAGASAPSEPVERTARWYRLMTYKLRQWCGDLPASAAHRFGTPNVGVVAHGKRLLAYGHSDVPYALSVSKEGEVSTLGPFNYYGALAHPFSAARVDEESGDMFVLGVQYEARPYLSLSVVNKAGVLTHSAPIYTSRASVTCDLAFTESMAVVWEQPFAFEGASLSALSRNPFRFDARRKLRIGVFPRASRNPDAQIRWFEAAPGFIFHAANAWDEKDSVVLVACRMGAMAWEWLCGIGDAESKEPFDWRHKPVLVRYDLSLSTGQLRETVLLDVAAELPTVNPAMQGRASRFVYLAHMSPDQFPLFDGLLKFDLGERQVVGNVTYDPDVYGGECRFVARDSANPTGEDDGYLVTFLSDVSAATTQFIVFDAKRLSADYKPIAVVDIATRVPFGLGGCFVPESVLRQVQQRAAGVARKEDDTAAREEQARALVVIRRAAAAAAQPAPSPSSAAAAPPSRASPANPSSGSSGPAAPSSTSARGERSGSIAASSGGPASRRRSSVTAAK